nr:uncharacterized protein LOC129528396 [Gorilla gorilla gorilla]
MAMIGSVQRGSSPPPPCKMAAARAAHVTGAPAPPPAPFWPLPAEARPWASAGDFQPDSRTTWMLRSAVLGRGDNPGCLGHSWGPDGIPRLLSSLHVVHQVRLPGEVRVSCGDSGLQAQVSRRPRAEASQDLTSEEHHHQHILKPAQIHWVGNLSHFSAGGILNNF